jgi:hypothetical protein
MSHPDQELAMFYAPEILPKAQDMLSALADVEFRYDAALVRVRQWRGRQHVKERWTEKLLAARERERARFGEEIERIHSRLQRASEPQ